MGFNGPKETIFLMSSKLVEIFGEIDVKILDSLMNSFMSGEIPLRGFSVTIIDISIGLRNLGLLTLEEKSRKEMGEALVQEYFK